LKKILVPRIDVNTEKVLINKWLFKNHSFVEKNSIIAVVETTKTALDILAPASGYFFSEYKIEEFVPIPKPIGYIFDTLEESKKYAAKLQKKSKENSRKQKGAVRATKKAITKAAELNVPLKKITKKGLITEKDVLEHLNKTQLPLKVFAAPLKQKKKTSANRVILIGAGRAATQVIEIIKLEKKQRIVGILDDTPEKWGSTISGIPVCGSTAIIKKLFGKKEYDAVIITISTSVLARERYRNICAEYAIPLTNAIHPTAVLSSNVKIGVGNVICALCYFGNDTIIGDNNFISANNSYDHHNIIGNNISTGPGCMTSGSVILGNKVRLGAGIFVEPLVELGNNVAIASGSIITASVEPDSVVKRKISSLIVSPPKG